MVLEQKNKKKNSERRTFFRRSSSFLLRKRILSGYGIKAWDGIEKACQKGEISYIMIQIVIGKSKSSGDFNRTEKGDLLHEYFKCRTSVPRLRRPRDF